MLPPLYISFCTTDGYAAEAAELKKTLDAFGLPYELHPVAPFESWVQACAFKPRFIRNAQAWHRDRPLVWLDADARVRQYPVLFDSMGKADFAAHWKGGTELLSGTMYFGPTVAAAQLLYDWEKACEASPEAWDQKVLQGIVESRPLNVRRLPAPYTLIFDLMAHEGPPVIEHMQASRRLKHT